MTIALLPEYSLTTLDRIHCLDALTLLRGLSSNYVDMALTSPPYDNLRTYNGYSWDFEGIAMEAYRVLKPGGVLVWVVGDATINGSETLTSFKQALYFKEVCGFNVHQILFFHDPGTAFPDLTRYTRQIEYMFILSKGIPQTIHLQVKRNKWAGDRRPAGSIKLQTEPNGKKSIRKRKPVKEFGVMGNMWTLGTGHGKSTHDSIAFQHPAIFPEALAERHILTWSNPGDIVMDFFMGSGTTAKMAMKHGRHYIGCDLSQEYVDLARKRLANCDPYQNSEVGDGITQLSLFAAVG